MDYRVDRSRTDELTQLRDALAAAYLERGRTGRKDAVWNRCFRGLSGAITTAVREGFCVHVVLCLQGEDARQVTIRTIICPSADGLIVSEHRPAPEEPVGNPKHYPRKTEVYLPDIESLEVRDERCSPLS